MEALSTVLRSPWNGRVSIALATEVGGFSTLGGALHPMRPITSKDTNP